MTRSRYIGKCGRTGQVNRDTSLVYSHSLQRFAAPKTETVSLCLVSLGLFFHYSAKISFYTHLRFLTLMCLLMMNSMVLTTCFVKYILLYTSKLSQGLWASKSSCAIRAMKHHSLLPFSTWVRILWIISYRTALCWFKILTLKTNSIFTLQCTQKKYSSGIL